MRWNDCGGSTGFQWKTLPKDLTPKSMAHYHFVLWDWDRTLERKARTVE
jgi:hypothetical protein